MQTAIVTNDGSQVTSTRRLSATERVAELLREQQPNRLPIWVRAPASGVEPYTGLTRGKLYQLANDGKIRSASIRDPGQAYGVRLFHLGSILAHIESCVIKPQNT